VTESVLLKIAVAAMSAARKISGCHFDIVPSRHFAIASGRNCTVGKPDA
jgi:hypothetical protein